MSKSRKQEEKLGDQYKTAIGDKIGSGSDGTVYELKIGGKYLSKKWVIKTANTSISPSEKNITARYFKTFSTGNRSLVTERIDGVRLDDLELTFQQKIQAKFYIVQILNRFHHFTSYGNPIVHNDIHHGNILFKTALNKITNKQEIKDVNIIDFGLSMELNDDNPEILHSDWNPAPLDFRPLVGKENQFRIPFFPVHTGIKSDIYQVGYLFRRHLYCKYADYPQIDNLNVGAWVDKFEGRMCLEHDYYRRPNSDEVLLFYTILYKLYATGNDHKDIDSNTKTALIAKLIILTNGNWSQKISIGNTSTDWNNFDFENKYNLPFCHAILNMNKYKLLQGNENIIAGDMVLAKMIASEPTPEGIIKNITDKFGLDFLCIVKGNLEHRRKIAEINISHLLNKAKNKRDVQNIMKTLESMAEANKIDFLYKRHGNYSTFSFHNHKWKNKKVSGTWIKIMAMVENRKNALSDDNFFETSMTPDVGYRSPII